MPGPFFYVRVRLAVRNELKKLKKDPALASTLTDAAIDAGVKQVKATKAVAAIGDGAILRKIVEFLQSDLGKALISLLVSLLV